MLLKHEKIDSKGMKVGAQPNSSKKLLDQPPIIRAATRQCFHHTWKLFLRGLVWSVKCEEKK